MKIVTESPFWFIVFCLITGLVYTFALYYKNPKNEFSPWTTRTMAIFRFISVSLITFLLLSPLLMTVFRRVEKPVILIAQDNSRSILINKDSSYYKTKYLKQLSELTNELSQTYEVKNFTFGSQVDDRQLQNFSEKQTDMSSLFEEMLTRYANRNVGALVIASDGIFNKGLSPSYTAEKFPFPVYTIALGDTNIPKDVLISRIDYNKMAFLGNTFPIEINISSAHCNGKQIKLNVSREKENLFNQNISLNGDKTLQTIPVQTKADKAGLQHYHISITGVDGEISKHNNLADVFIEVIDSRQKILILYNSPHPDIAAIKESLEGNPNYEVETFATSDFNQAISKYNLVVLHQLPSTNNTASNLVRQINQNKIPALYILGSQTDLSNFNRLNTGLNILAAKSNVNEALPVINPQFPLFTTDDDLLKLSENFPPLISPYGDYKTSNATNTLFTQKIGSVKTNQPLILFANNLQAKTGIIAGEGIWRWRITDFVKNNSHMVFDQFISKIIQYLSVKEDKSFFRINCNHNFLENEPVEFTAEVYNQSYELITTPEVNLIITDEKGKNYPYVFTKTSNSYYLNAGSFPVGNYKYKAQTKEGGKIYTKTGEFIMVPLNVEALNTVADHNLLYKLAKNHSGEMFYPSNMQQLVNKLQKREDIKKVSYAEKRYNDFNNVFWILLLLLALLGAEWFMRKRAGGY